MVFGRQGFSGGPSEWNSSGNLQGTRGFWGNCERVGFCYTLGPVFADPIRGAKRAGTTADSVPFVPCVSRLILSLDQKRILRVERPPKR
jgi:hypothetical protein